MKIRSKLLLFGLAAAAVTALAVFLVGGALLRSSVGDRVRERLDHEVGLLGDTLAKDPTLLPSPPDATGRVPERTEGQRALTGRQAARSSSEPTELASIPVASADGPGKPPAAPGGGCEACDEFADRAAARLALRVTIVALDGRVLGDSSLDADGLRREENHVHRPEIVQARTEGAGSSTRHSATVNDNLFYVARRVDRDGQPVGFVRLAIAVSEVQRVTGRYRETLALMGFVVLLAVAIVGRFAASRFSRPIEEMCRAADAIGAGRLDVEVEYDASDELGRLGGALNQMALKLGEQIGALSSEKKLRDTILEGMKEGILVVDRNRRVLLANTALRKIMRLSEQSVSGRPILEMTRDLAVIDAFDAALDRGVESQETARAAAGEGRSFELTVAPLKGPDGRQVGAIGIFFDVTRLHALEGVRREFVADVSHELRTPLTSIKAFVETLLGGGLEDTGNNRRFLEIIEKHAGRMEAILDDLADLSLIETGATVLEPSRLDLQTMVRDLMESLRPQADARSVSLASEVPHGLSLEADRRRLEQILVNLVDNAIKFNRPGGRVTVRARALGGAPPSVLIEVEDTGIGIPPDALDRIFRRFFRVDRASSREMGGTGLGLAIVKHLMRLHGGAVRVESRQGEGSRFILEFPTEAAGARAAS